MRTVISALFLFLTLAQFASAEDFADKRFAAVAPKVKEMIAGNELAGGVVLVAQHGKVVYLQAFGEADLNSHKPMKTDTIFRIHSMTKSIVTAAALMLYEEGKFDLDDPVAKYIPAFGERKDLTKMTVKNLMTHTSGLSYSVKKEVWNGDLEQFADNIAAAPLAHEPNTDWTYGVSIDILGRLVEIWSGDSLDDFLATRIFKPLEMNDTGFFVPKSKADRLATLYKRSKSGLEVVPTSDDKDRFVRPKLLSGGGGLVSTATDYFRFLNMIQNEGKVGDERFLKKKTVALMTSDQLPSTIGHIHFGDQQRIGVGFGLGFSVVKEESDKWDADGRLGEYGWGGAASCHYWVLPKEDLVVITLEQTMPYQWSLEKALKPLIYAALKK